jgi:hypothetical protein
MKKSFSTPWTREFFANLTFYFVLASFLLTYVWSLPFVSFTSTMRTRRRVLPLLLLLRLWLPIEPSLQEAAPMVKSPKAPVKRVASTHGSKRVNKSTDAGASLDTHRSTSSSDDVRNAPDIFALFLA